jgi:dTDP-4-dehydrorhamnose reductase
MVDLGKPDSMRMAIRALRPDLIVNAAAYTAVDKAESEPTLAHAINGVAPGVLAEEARRLGAVLVHYSSDYVFDGLSHVPYVECDTPLPVNAYGRSKRAGEAAVAAIGGAYLILRTSWVYDSRGDNFLLKMLSAAEARDEVRVVDDQTGSPTWARALAKATVTLIRHTARVRDTPGVYHLAGIGAVTRYDFVRRALELSSRQHPLCKLARVLPAKSADFPLPAARPAYSALDSTKISETFGIEITGWETQLKDCLAHRVV